MTGIEKYFFIASFFISTLFLPWWVSVVLGVVLLAFWQTYVSVLAGALLMDIVFGAPLIGLGTTTHLYMYIFCGLAVVTLILNRAMLE